MDARAGVRRCISGGGDRPRSGRSGRGGHEDGRSDRGRARDVASLERTSAAAGGERGGEHREGREPGERRSLRYLEVRGGGANPYRPKGAADALLGPARSPQQSGGDGVEDRVQRE